MARRARCCLASSCRMSHFGAKPMRGGKPARDSMTRGARAVAVGDFDHVEASMLIEVALLRANKLKTANVITI